MHLVWFRNDLRLINNSALTAACQAGEPVMACYINCVKQTERHHMAPIQRDLIERQLQFISDELAQLGIPFTAINLDYFDDIEATLSRLVSEHTITHIHANYEVGLNERRRDQQLREQLAIPLLTYNGDCVVQPGELKTGAGEMYKVYTPFSRAWIAHLESQSFTCYSRPAAIAPAVSHHKVVLNGEKTSSAEFGVGEKHIAKLLAEFCAQALVDYHDDRDFPAIDGTSKLSPYFAIGALSPEQCLVAIENQIGHLPLHRGEPGFAWLNEIIWREFYRHLMHAYPHLSMSRAFKPHTDALVWSSDSTAFEQWQQGNTGFPIIDAAMRCLNATGWMHNRLRMVVASFFTKDLHLDWRQGEAYFMEHLIDGDFASNNGGWQWAAGTGADAAPYFRIFNPTSQSKRFDADGTFIRQWVPELANVPAKFIHEPYNWLTGNELDNHYPAPIVDHAASRKHAIAMFEALKSQPA